MCVVALAWQVHPEWPLVLVGNRDEFHARPAAPLHEWSDGSGLVGGRDEQAGGTWLALERSKGHVAVITNVRGSPPDPAKASRGALVTDMLRGTGPYASPAPEALDGFNAFNLFSVGPHSASLLSNRPHAEIRSLSPGVHAIANEPLGRPCPRADRLRALVAEGVTAYSDPHHLLDALSETSDPALFLTGEFYGTRASTLVAIDKAGRVVFVERRYEAGGRPAGTTALEFSLG